MDGGAGAGDTYAMAAEARQPGTLVEAQDRFVAVWGQMASAWGISRTMSEVHALLYITGQPLNTDEIMERLQISRGNASMSLRALLDWGLVQRTHKRGDRKEYFTAEQDVWAMFRAVLRERLKREFDPLLASIYEIRDLTGVEAVKGKAAAVEDKQRIVEHNKRLEAMLEFFQIMDKLSQRFVSPSGRGLQAAATVLGRVVG